MRIAIILCIAPFFLFAQKEVSRDEILANEFWKIEYDHFVPNRHILASIDDRIKGELNIDVYFAFWCEDSLNHVPAFIRLIELLSTRSLIKVRYFDVGARKARETPYYVEKEKIEKIPTFIFFREGKEIGRIVENPAQSIGEDILLIVF